MQLMLWQRKVAHATPATPILNAVTKSISTPMLDTDEQARKMNGGFQFAVFSCAEKRQTEFPQHS